LGHTSVQDGDINLKFCVLEPQNEQLSFFFFEIVWFRIVVTTAVLMATEGLGWKMSY